MARHDDYRRDAVVALKWPAHVAGAGLARVLKYSVKRSVEGASECEVFAVLARGKWFDVPRQLVWVREDCVVSRQYIDQAPKVQAAINFEGDQ